MNEMTMETLLDLIRREGDRSCNGEPVSLLEHAWQCGHLAAKSGASMALQLASWLHDVGHLLLDDGDAFERPGSHERHAQVAAPVLLALWGPEVSEPVRLHVMARRYLVARHPKYAQKLSKRSQRQLQLEGGALSEEACLSFEVEPFWREALQLRIWDDLCMRPGWFASSRLEALQALEQLMWQVRGFTQISSK